MYSKFILHLCGQIVLTQCVFSQCTSRAAVDATGIARPFGWTRPGVTAPAFESTFAYSGQAAPFGYNSLCNLGGSHLAYKGLNPAVISALKFSPTTSGAFSLSSASAISPSGISIQSDNAFEGILEVGGELPFMGTASLEGVLPSYGAGAINHVCGNGINAMTALSDTSSLASVTAVPGFSAPALAYNVPSGISYGYDGLVYDSPVNGLDFSGTNGEALPVTSASALNPSGIVLNSETIYDGPLAVVGELPFVGTVGVNGVLPTAGAGAVNHACGNGINVMASGPAAFASGISPAAPIAPGLGCGNRYGFGL